MSYDEFKALKPGDKIKRFVGINDGNVPMWVVYSVVHINPETNFILVQSMDIITSNQRDTIELP